MEEEELDYETPIGQKIKQINALIKKPKLDEELGLALDAFDDKIAKQRVYLNNGIFNINFAEAALFLQSCANLYGKKVDLLWDELLEFHTRLIEYDCEHEKEKGNNMDTNIIQQLEERRNRYKRKKKFKLVLSCDDRIEELIFDKPIPPIENTFDSDEGVLQRWKQLKQKSAKVTSIPNAVYKQQLQMYRMKNYYIMKHQNYDIYDLEDGEFNIKYGRIPGWHFIQHLFEYNEKGLLPDKNNLIATLRLGAYLRLAFMRDNKIPLNSEYEVYKDRYLAFKKKFFEEEAKKWQNMPLDTMEDLHKQLQYLADKERETLSQQNSGSKSCSFSSLNKIIHCCDDGSESSVVDSDTDSLFELSFNSDYMLKSDLCVRLERMPGDVNMKSRQDSGFFERAINSDDDLENDEELTGDGNSNQTEKHVTASSDHDNTTENNVPSDCLPLANHKVVPEIDTSVNLSAITDDSSTQNKENLDPDSLEADDFDTKSVASDHSYCRTRSSKNVMEVNVNESKKRSVQNKKEKSSSFVSSLTMTIPRAMRSRNPKEKNVKETNTEELNPSSPAKRRKMTKKQLEKLIDKMIVLPTVKENKFEHFFSKNYQPQLGEGVVQEMDYNSDPETGENHAQAKDPSSPTHPNQEDDTHSVFSDHNYTQPAENSTESYPGGKSPPLTDIPPELDTQSVVSDHNYSQLVDDSGFIDGQLEGEDNIDGSAESRVTESDSGGAEKTSENVDPQEEEYQRLLKALRDSRGSMDREMERTPEDLRTEQQRQEKERQEARARVDQWKDTINPILRNLHEKEFDIHDYGSGIMEGMEVNQSKPFASIVKGKSSAEVVRYFIASLQLANTYNIEICGAKKGELSNDSYNVKLLKHDRYHEHLTDYQAPSEETLKERLKRIKTIRKEEENGMSESPTKKQRLSDTPKRAKQPRSYSTSSLRNSLDSSPPLLSRMSSQDSVDPRLSQPNTHKGKTVMKVVVPCVKTSLMTAPSTSKQVFWPDSSDFSCDSNFSATEESFLECLVDKQLQNSDVQLFSTPKSIFD